MWSLPDRCYTVPQNPPPSNVLQENRSLFLFLSFFIKHLNLKEAISLGYLSVLEI